MSGRRAVRWRRGCGGGGGGSGDGSPRHQQPATPAARDASGPHTAWLIQAAPYGNSSEAPPPHRRSGGVMGPLARGGGGGAPPSDASLATLPPPPRAPPTGPARLGPIRGRHPAPTADPACISRYSAQTRSRARLAACARQRARAPVSDEPHAPRVGWGPSLLPRPCPDHPRAARARAPHHEKMAHRAHRGEADVRGHNRVQARRAYAGRAGRSAPTLPGSKQKSGRGSRSPRSIWRGGGSSRPFRT